MDDIFAYEEPKKRPQKRTVKNGVSSPNCETSQSMAKKKPRKLQTKETDMNLLQIVTDAMAPLSDNCKQFNEEFLNNLNNLKKDIMADHEVIQQNTQKLTHMSNSLQKSMQQVCAAQEKKLLEIDSIHEAFKKRSEQLQKENESQTNLLKKELEDYMAKVQQKLTDDCRRTSFLEAQKIMQAALNFD